MRRHERGFTLAEMMTVVAIIGVLVSLAIVYMRPHARPLDVAQRLGTMASEANRLALQYGPVRSDIAQVEGKSRTRITAELVDSTLQFTLWLVEEAAPPTTAIMLVPIQTYPVPRTITADAYATSVGTYSTVTPVTDWSTFTLNCYPNGTCDGRTLFFSSGSGMSSERQARLSILPIGGGGHVLRSWN